MDQSGLIGAASNEHRHFKPKLKIESAFASTREAADFLNLSKSQVNKLVAQGSIPSQRFGRTIRISWKWLQEKQ